MENALASHKKGVGALFAFHFSKDLKFLKKSLVLPKNMRKKADYFGGAKSFEKRMYRCMIHRLFHQNIRSKADFYAHTESVATIILPKGRKFANLSMSVIEAYHETRTVFYNLETAHNSNHGVLEFLKGLRAELSRLVPDTFMDLYGTDRLIHLPRYIKAGAIRAERALVNFEKDQTKAQEIDIFARSLNTLLQGLSPAVSERKKAAVEAYFWLIEEYKISVFAQELKTPVRVSKKRLEEKLREIERMV
jgi:ATP-dependent helicase HrpA